MLTQPEIHSLGVASYKEVWELQKQFQRELIDGSGVEHIIFCRHNPVVTLGRSSNPLNILSSEAELLKMNIELFKIERGGDVTYHDEGQLTVYPILDLNLRKRDVHLYMRSLEESLIDCLRDFDIEGIQVAGKTGVWTVPKQNATNFSALKIASIGVRLSRWVTLHGLSLYVKDSTLGFQCINPCGFNSSEMTCMEAELGRELSFESVEDSMRSALLNRFF